MPRVPSLLPHPLLSLLLLLLWLLLNNSATAGRSGREPSWAGDEWQVAGGCTVVQ